jgi:hypothetical protein
MPIYPFVPPPGERRYPPSGNRVEVTPEALVQRVWDLKAKSDRLKKKRELEDQGIYELDLDE